MNRLWIRAVEKRGGQPGVAVIEPGDRETGGERGAEVVGPVQHLHPQAHHQQKGLPGWRPEGLVGDLHLTVARPRDAHLAHLPRS
jgi:hypothetical protein